MTIQNKRLQPNKDSLIQLQQKNIHYRSEISRLNNLIEDYKKKWNEMKTNVTSLEKQLQLVENEKNDALTKSIINPIAFFDYSVILPDRSTDDETMILGNFIIKNLGNTPLTMPVICLRITPITAGKLAGKIRYKKNTQSSSELQIFSDTAAEEWVFVDDNWQEKVQKQGEYWLKANHRTIIPPNEQIHFSNFELSLHLEKVSSIVLNGFVYFEQLPEGISALNEIRIN